MIPSYSEEVKIQIVERDDRNFADQISDLKEQLDRLRETVEYINRERSRMKSELEEIKHSIRKN